MWREEKLEAATVKDGEACLAQWGLSKASREAQASGQSHSMEPPLLQLTLLALIGGGGSREEG